MTKNTSTANRHPPVDSPAAVDTKHAPRRSPWPLAVVAALFIIIPFVFWYGTWFGRALTNGEIEKYLADESKPRYVQHALSQVAERIARHEPSVERFYPRVLSVSESANTDLRMTAAWVMGEEHKSEEFRAGLLRLLNDREPIVRRNAALALVRFGDRRSRPELRDMLRPFTVTAPAEGLIVSALPPGAYVKRDAALTRLKLKDDAPPLDVRSPLVGRVEHTSVKDGDAVRAGDGVAVLAPDADSVWEALRALSVVGASEDLPEVERYAGGVEGMPARIKQQAALTVEAVKRRESQTSLPNDQPSMN